MQEAASKKFDKPRLRMAVITALAAVFVTTTAVMKSGNGSGPDVPTKPTVTIGAVQSSGLAATAIFNDINPDNEGPIAGQPSVGPTVTVPAGETVHISFPQPFVLSTESRATTSCLLVTWSGPASLQFAVVGHRF